MFGACKWIIPIISSSLNALTATPLRKLVTRVSRPVIVGQCLAFEDDEGKMHPMDPAQLKELVEAGRSSGASRTGH